MAIYCQNSDLFLVYVKHSLTFKTLLFNQLETSGRGGGVIMGGVPQLLVYVLVM